MPFFVTFLLFVTVASNGQSSSPVSGEQDRTTAVRGEDACKAVAMDDLPRAPYPEQARGENIVGEVVLKVHVLPTLHIQDVEVVSGNPLLADSAVNAAKQLKLSHLRNQVDPWPCAMNLKFRFSGSAFGEVPRAIRVTEAVASKLLIHRVDPVHPDSARQVHAKGNVLLTILIDEHGTVTSSKVISGAPELVSAAQDAVKQWRYKPFVLNGVPASMDTIATVRFKK